MALFIISDQVTAATLTMPIRMVAMALISGVTPRRTDEKMRIGRVVEPGPDRKLAITRSSSDRVKLSSQPATMAGAIFSAISSIGTFQGMMAPTTPSGSGRAGWRCCCQWV